ncbi:tetratricopeptide repeat-containing sensor histidine kinase [Tenacibaculum aquimarinum]|uniref:tetratricopeptide repeat-containing sensor histidine kinase n=1 Tax=Tenacibaculum aquimarinum TaxID=2910675 RepID=UPI001F0A3FD1|nr:tetratricopeptide repeat-containing sensor histidine kinase [Tenacibaculum aquimarinum]MCH3883606.1 ATP-binding protein [Tenacibaculum aquimarinum]
MKKTLFLFLFFSAFIVFSQKQQDSITFYLKNAKGANKFSYLKRAVLLSEELKIDSLIKQTNLEYAKHSYFAKDTLGLTFSTNKLLKHFQLKKDSFSLAKAYHLEALNHKIKNNLDSTFYYHHKSKNVSIALKDSIEIGRRLLSMAILQVKELDYLGCQITTIEGLKYIEPTKEYRTLISLYQTLGNALGHLKKPKEARNYYTKAQEIVKFNNVKSRRERNYLNLLSNIGITFKDERKFKKAASLFKEGLNFDSIETKHPTQYQNLLGNLSSISFRQGYTKKAIEGYKTVLKSRIKTKNLYAQSVSNGLLAEAYLKNKQYELAKKHAKTGLELGKKTRNNEQVLGCLKILSELTNEKTAKKYLEEYIKLSDSLLTKERNLKNQFAKVRYETDKKDKENADLKQENTEKQLLLESEQQQKIIGWLIAGASILFLAFGFTIASNRRKKLLFDSKLQKIEAREKERQQIAKSLHDEVAGDIRMLHLKLAKTNLLDETKKLDVINEKVRNLSHQLSSESFNEVFFKDQIINLISDFFDSDFRIKAEKIDSVNWKNINNTIKRTLFLIIRESIQNAKKHATAKKVTLHFSETKKAVFLTISDNGKGFNIDDKKNGIGLKNIKERTEEINGVFYIESELEKGTTIKIEIPKNGN